MTFTAMTMFFMSHVTPKMSIKTHLIFSGHLNEYISSDIEYNELQNHLDKEELEAKNYKVYNLTNISSSSSLFNFKVKKVGFLYFASKSGEA